VIVALPFYVVICRSGGGDSVPSEGLPLYDRQMDTAKGVEKQLQESLDERMRAHNDTD